MGELSPLGEAQSARAERREGRQEDACTVDWVSALFRSTFSEALVLQVRVDFPCWSYDPRSELFTSRCLFQDDARLL